MRRTAHTSLRRKKKALIELRLLMQTNIKKGLSIRMGSLRLKSDSVKNYLEFIFLRSVRQSGITIQEVRIPHPMKWLGETGHHHFRRQREIVEDRGENIDSKWTWVITREIWRPVEEERLGKKAQREQWETNSMIQRFPMKCHHFGEGMPVSR